MTDYNSNESSNLDDHEFSWAEEEDLFHVDSNHFKGGVFDFPMMETRNPNDHHQASIREMHSPKKRLYCNRKKVPHWAENDEVQKYIDIGLENSNIVSIVGTPKTR